VGVPSLRQIYAYLSDPHCKRIGHQTFLSAIILVTELFVIVKHGQGEFPRPMPEHILRNLIIFFVLYFGAILVLMMRRRSGDKDEENMSQGTRNQRAVKQQ
jgi:phosphatidylserine synthase 1